MYSNFSTYLFLLSDYHYNIMISKVVLHIMICYSYNCATELYKPGKTGFPALIPQNGALAEMMLGGEITNV